MSIRLNLLSVSFPFEEERNLRTSKDFTSNSFAQRKVDKQVLCFFHPTKYWAKKSTIQTVIFLRIWVTHGVSPWKLFGCCVKKGFNKEFMHLRKLTFWRFKMIGVSKVQQLQKEEGWTRFEIKGKNKKGRDLQRTIFLLGPTFFHLKKLGLKKIKIDAPPQFQDSIIFEKFVTIGYQDTNRHTTLLREKNTDVYDRNYRMF